MGMMLGGMTHTAMAGPGADKSRVYVAFKNGAMGPTYRALKRNGAEFHHTFDKLNAFVVTMPVQALNGLRNNPNIEYIEEDVKRYPMAQTTPWGIPAVQADLVSYNAASGLTVCIIDSGYSVHEDLPQGIGSNVSGFAEGDSGTWNIDSCGHGTHVAGTIAALSANDSSDVGVVGVVPGDDINLYIVKVFGNDVNPGGGSCAWTYSSSLVAALDKCKTEGGAKIVSMSLGGSFKSRTEDRAFSDANNAGVLSIAAAGNGGNTRKSYPASYGSVMSVAAVDSALNIADFSQQNDQVEIAAPGVAVRSTVPMGTGTEESATVADVGYEAIAMEGSKNGTGSGKLVDCGLGTSACSEALGNVCLIKRGDVSFADKVSNCESEGGTAAIIYNNAPGLFSGTLGGAATFIPSVGVSQASGQAMALTLASGSNASVTVEQGNYAYFDGTSMATPHVSGVAALVWSQDATCSNQDIRNVLTGSALDLGPAGKDNAYGYGLVQAADAVADLGIDCGGGGGGDDPAMCINPGGAPKGASCSADSECCSDNCKGKRGSKTCK